MQVRRLRGGEGGQIRELRLRALREAPSAFSSAFAEEEDKPLGEWEDLARRSEHAQADVVFVAIEGTAWLGMAGGYLVTDRVPSAAVWGMWVAPEARGRGLGEQLLEAVAGWAQERGAATLRLSVSGAAAAAASLYRRAGFEPTGEQRPLGSDPSLTQIVMSRPLGRVRG